MAVYLTSDIESSLLNIIKFFEQFKNFHNNSKVLFTGSVRTIVQSIFESIQTKFAPDRQLIEVILSHAVSAELSSPGGFDIFIEEFQKLISLHRKNLLMHGCLLKTTQSHSLKPTEEIIFRYIDENMQGFSDEIKNIVKTSIELAGTNGRISFEPTFSYVKSVELVSGYNFALNPAFKAKCAFLDARIITIDGYIESVGEAHKLFQNVYESKVPVLLFLRGMADEVLQTMKVNYDRGTMKLIPFVVPLDVMYINTLNDLAVISGGDVLSTNKGELISMINLTSYPLVDRVDVNEDSVTITCSLTKESVNKHVKNILEKKEKLSVDQNLQYSILYDQRLRDLSQSRVIVRINESENLFYTQSVFDRIYRGIRSMSDHGYNIINDKVVPRMSIHAGMLYAKKCVDVVSNIDCIVTRKKNDNKVKSQS